MGVLRKDAIGAGPAWNPHAYWLAARLPLVTANGAIGDTTLTIWPIIWHGTIGTNKLSTDYELSTGDMIGIICLWISDTGEKVGTLIATE
jgi:hypothetical protein